MRAAHGHTPIRLRMQAVAALYHVLRSWGHGRLRSAWGALHFERLAERRARTPELEVSDVE